MPIDDALGAVAGHTLRLGEGDGGLLPQPSTTPHARDSSDPDVAE